MDKRIGFGLYQSCRNGGVLDVCRCLGCGGVGGVGGEWLWWLDQGLEWWGGVIIVLVVSLYSLCRWQVQVSVYCDRRIHTQIKYTQYSILLHLIDICFLPCICLWQILQFQTCLCVVVGPRFASTSPAFMRSRASHPEGPHGRLVPPHHKTYKSAHPLLGSGGFGTICTAVCQNRCDSSTTCRLCRPEPY